jgi:hypothetical protein
MISRYLRNYYYTTMNNEHNIRGYCILNNYYWFMRYNRFEFNIKNIKNVDKKCTFRLHNGLSFERFYLRHAITKLINLHFEHYRFMGLRFYIKKHFCPVG